MRTTTRDFDGSESIDPRDDDADYHGPDHFDDDRDDGPIEFSESEAGQRARDRWAEDYDELNGAPENDEDR